MHPSITSSSKHSRCSLWILIEWLHSTRWSRRSWWIRSCRCWRWLWGWRYGRRQCRSRRISRLQSWSSCYAKYLSISLKSKFPTHKVENNLRAIILSLVYATIIVDIANNFQCFVIESRFINEFDFRSWSNGINGRWYASRCRRCRWCLRKTIIATRYHCYFIRRSWCYWSFNSTWFPKD